MQHPSRLPPTHIEGTARADSVAATASRFFVSMRKSFSPPSSPRRKTTAEGAVCPSTPNSYHPSPPGVMYSTPEERHAYSRAGRSRCLDARPTIEQISMGLHVSRTPHLRPIPSTLHRCSVPSHRSVSTYLPDVPRDRTASCRTSPSLPPPPPRSSMKKTVILASTLAHPPQHLPSSAGSPSTSVAASASPVPPSSPRPLSSLRARMSKFIPGYRPPNLPSSLGRASSFTSSASDSTRPGTPRKAVRFSTSVLAIDEHS